MVRWLVESGHDVLLSRGIQPRAADPGLLALAHESGRIVLTRDKDFGDLIFRDGIPTAGVILVRLRASDQFERRELLKPFWPEMETSAPGAMVVVANDRIRIRPLL